MSDKADSAKEALSLMGKDLEFRQGLKDLIHAYEARHASFNHSIRDEITAAVIDALHIGTETYRVYLKGGYKFDFLYRSKIARELVMTRPTELSHVWEPQTTKLIHKILSFRPGNAFIGGAYSGDHGLIAAAELAKSKKVVVAVEPNPDQRNMFQQNCETNAIDNVRLHPWGLWDSDGKHLELVGFDSFATVEERVEPSPSTFTTYTIDTIVKNDGLTPDSFSLVLLDIEGSEFRALKGAMSLLKQDKSSCPFIIFEVHRNYVNWASGIDNTEIVKFLRELGYELYSIRDYNSNIEMGASAIELIPIEKTYLEGPPHGFNVLALKDERFLKLNGINLCEGVSPKLLLHKDPKFHAPLC